MQTLAPDSVKYIVFHGSASSFGDDELLRKWHVNQNGWEDIGYHYLILNGRIKKFNDRHPSRDGEIIQCRPIQYQGAHCIPVNSKSIGICFISMGSPALYVTDRQLISAKYLVRYLMNLFDLTPRSVLGHKELEPERKKDPYFSMDAFRNRMLK